jgi:hypothetical protein
MEAFRIKYNREDKSREENVENGIRMNDELAAVYRNDKKVC